MTISIRLLSIGEFAAATQLSPKALRIYDEQRLLVPARTDTATGYRLYRSDQVATGRLIRALREMGLSLTDIAVVVSTEDRGAEALLAEFARELEHRHARERRAYHSALLLLRKATPIAGPSVMERARPETIVIVQPFLASRYDFVERFRAETQTTLELIAHAGLQPGGEPLCALVDPLSEDEGRLEVIAPVARPVQVPNGLTLRVLPAASCAVVTMTARITHASELSAGLDVLFDWFDRRSLRASATPLVSIEIDAGLQTEITWAFERPDA